MDSSTNIIPFPRKNNNPNVQEPASIEEIEAGADNIRHIHIMNALEHVIPQLFDNLAILGFTPDENLFVKDSAFIVEALRSMLNKTYNMPHPMQLIADNMFKNMDDGSIELVDGKIRIELIPNNKE